MNTFIMNRKIITFFILVAIFTLNIIGFGKDKPDNEIKELASAGFKFILDKIPAGSETNYGFNNRGEFSKVTVGAPFQVYTIVSESLKGKLSSSKNYFVPIDEWRIPLVVDGQNRALLTAAPMNGEWKIVDFGAAGLASEIGEFDSKHPAVASTQRKILLRIYPLQIDFLLYQSETAGLPQQTIYPLQSAARMLKSSVKAGKSVLMLNDILPVIKSKLVEQHIIEDK
ncbi:MAG: hypothetical protein ACHQQQ_10365 [Bacteroidota bacterium]